MGRRVSRPDSFRDTAPLEIPDLCGLPHRALGAPLLGPAWPQPTLCGHSLSLNEIPISCVPTLCNSGLRLNLVRVSFEGVAVPETQGLSSGWQHSEVLCLCHPRPQASGSQSMPLD